MYIYVKAIVKILKKINFSMNYLPRFTVCFFLGKKKIKSKLYQNES